MKPRIHKGFTLVEMAIVLSIIALILGTGLALLSAQQDQRRIEETKARLYEAREALIGFAITYGRLPCPAIASTNGEESPVVVTGVCSNPWNGLIPAATLGLSPVDSQGFAIDAWNNRIRYAVTTSNGSAFTTVNGMQTTGMGTLAPDLAVCDSATGITGTACATAISLTNSAPAVIYSLGPNGATGGTGADETANLDNNRVFISHSPAPVEAAGGYFDDQLTWISPNILFNRMVQAGKLP